MRQAGGFTLLELTVVVALLGILTAVILPEMRGSYADAVLRAGGRDLANVCAIASSRAVSFNRLHRVLVDPATGRFRVERKGRGRDGASGYVPVREVAGTEGVLDRRVHVRLQPAGQPLELPAESPGMPAGDEGVSESLAGASPAPEGSEVTGSQPRAVSFYPDGTADAVAIVLRDEDGFGLALRINPVTGRVRIQELRHQ